MKTLAIHLKKLNLSKKSKVELKIKKNMFFKKVKIIAEAGVNHNGNIVYAKKLIDKAKLCGADYIKFQTFDPNLIVTNNSEIAPYQKKFLPNTNNQKKMLSNLSLSSSQFIDLANYCKKKRLSF